MSGMSRHIRDRFSSFNYMYIVSEALIIFTLIAEDQTFFQKHSIYTLLIGILAFVSATWQYMIVRSIDAVFTGFATEN